MVGKMKYLRKKRWRDEEEGRKLTVFRLMLNPYLYRMLLLCCSVVELKQKLVYYSSKSINEPRFSLQGPSLSIFLGGLASLFWGDDLPTKGMEQPREGTVIQYGNTTTDNNNV